MVYMITYDLNNPGQNYEKLIEAIKKASNGIWCSFWKSSFLIQSNFITADEVLKKIKDYLDSNDRLIVIEVTNNYQGWLADEEWNYINDTIFDSPIF